MMSNRKGTKGFLFGALAGGVIGSVAALLFTPKTGREMRGEIAAGAHKVGDSTMRAAGKVGETTERLAKEIGGQAKHMADRMAAAVQGFKEAGKAEDSAELATVSSVAADRSYADETFEQALGVDAADDAADDADESI